MDIFKQANVNMATKYDYNAPVQIKNRGKLAKMLSRYARRKLKASISRMT